LRLDFSVGKSLAEMMAFIQFGEFADSWKSLARQAAGGMRQVKWVG
jgi:hypothetical protein